MEEVLGGIAERVPGEILAGTPLTPETILKTIREVIPETIPEGAPGKNPGGSAWRNIRGSSCKNTGLVF